MKSIVNLENLLVFLWLCILCSINSLYVSTKLIQDINILYYFSSRQIFILLNYIRFFIPFIVLGILIILVLINPIKKSNAFIYIFFTFWVVQITAFFLSDRYSLSLETFNKPLYLGLYNINEYQESLFTSIQLISASLSCLLILLIAENSKFENCKKKIFIVSLCFIGIIAIYFSFNLINEAILKNNKFIYSSEVLSPMGLTLAQSNPRVTGISRMILIFYFLFFCILLNNDKKIIWYIILIILGLLIYKMQTRGAFIGIVLLYSIFFLLYPIKLKKKIFILIILLIIPIFSFETYYNYTAQNKIENFQKNTKDNLKYDKDNLKYDKDNLEQNLKDDIVTKTGNRLLIPQSSGRIVIWKNIIEIIKNKKIIIGYGPQSDRVLLTNQKLQDKNHTFFLDKNNNYIFDNNSSNSFLYAYLSGGVFASGLLLIIYFLAVKKIFNYFFLKKIFKQKNILQIFSSILLLYLLMRGIFENSFAVFGIDYIFFLLSYLTLTSKIKLSRKI